MLGLQFYIYAFKKERKNSLTLYLFLLIISVTISIAVSFLFYIIYGNILLNIFKELEIFYAPIVLLPLYIILISSYLWISNFLISKVINNEDKTFLLIRAKNTKYSFLKTIIIFSLITIIITYIGCSFYLLSLERETYEYLNYNKNSRKEHFEITIIEEYENSRELKDFKTVSILKFEKRNNKFYYPEHIRKHIISIIHNEISNNKITTIFYDCTYDLNCKKENLNYTTDKELENQIFLKDFGVLIIAKNDTDYILFLLPEINYEFISNFNFFWGNKLLEKSEIAINLNSEFIKLYQSIVKREILIQKNSFKRIFFIKDELCNISKDSNKFLYFENYNFVLYKKLIETIKAESGWIEKNLLYNTIFYDDTKNLEEHSKKLQENIQELYDNLINKIKFADENLSENARFSYLVIFANYYPAFINRNLKNDYLYNVGNITINLDITFHTLCNGSEYDYFNNIFSEELSKINKEYQNILNEDDEIEKLLKLKYLETKVGYILNFVCGIIYKGPSTQFDNCVSVTTISKNPYLCNNYECVIKNAKFDKRICYSYSHYPSFRKECLEEYKKQTT
ncbi:MAG: hypothetical protein QXU20_03860 [Candidatus Woesearchaeota archaeon]